MLLAYMQFCLFFLHLGEVVNIDFVLSLPRKLMKHGSIFVVVVGIFSKMTYLFLKGVVRLYSLSKTIIYDMLDL